jgi:predicted Holliday junction resolvase-like endonuclease
MESELLLIWAVITTIFLMIIVIFLIKLQKKHNDDVEELKQNNSKAITRALNAQRSSTKGKINEQVASLMPEFSEKFKASDARFLGSPIDFVIFKNMSKFDKIIKDEENPIEIVLVDIKTGKSKRLTDLEKAIKIACEEGRISFEQIDIEESSKNLE